MLKKWIDGDILSNTLPQCRYVISDFDGTITKLEVDWVNLRKSLGVDSIDRLLAYGESPSWSTLTNAELMSVTALWASGDVMNAIENAKAFSVLTNNSEKTVQRFFEIQDSVSVKPATVVGRESINGSKTNFHNFRSGIERCLNTMACEDGDEIWYIGDSIYEIEFASKLGLSSYKVKQDGMLSQFQGEVL